MNLFHNINQIPKGICYSYFHSNHTGRRNIKRMQQFLEKSLHTHIISSFTQMKVNRILFRINSKISIHPLSLYPCHLLSLNRSFKIKPNSFLNPGSILIKPTHNCRISQCYFSFFRHFHQITKTEIALLEL